MASNLLYTIIEAGTWIFIIITISMIIYTIGLIIHLWWTEGRLHIGRLDTDRWNSVDYKEWYFAQIKELTPLSKREQFIKLIVKRFWLS